MAIIPWLKGLEVTVKVDGQPATEYDPPEPERAPEKMQFHERDQSLSNGVPYVLKYIQAKPDAPFSFHAHRSTNFQYYGGHQIGITAEVDGREIPGLQIETHAANKLHQNNNTSLKSTGVLEGSSAGGWVKCPFRFSNLNIVEDGVPAKDTKEQILQATNLGHLRVYCYRLGQSVPNQQRSYHHTADPALKETSSMSEKALKGRALDCRVASARASVIPDSALTRPPGKIPGDALWPSLNFAIDPWYLIIEGLYKEAIIPRPQLNPSPYPADEADAAPTREVDAFALLEVEARQMLQCLLDWKEPCIKPENADVGGRDAAIDVDESPHVKSESTCGVKRRRSGTMETRAASLARYKERKLRNGRIEIDLTDD